MIAARRTSFDSAVRPSDATLRRRAHERFAIASKAEKEYMRSLRMLTRQIDNMVKTMVPKGQQVDVRQSAALQRMLQQYSQTINPWAQSVATKMVERIARKDELNWAMLGSAVGRSLKEELVNAPTGEALRQFMAEQVRLITSLPLEAAQRVHHLTLEGITQGRRAEDITREILETGDVTESRARLIARTEVARTASGLTMARAKHVGSTHYIWRTSNDTTVRESHKKMNGKVFAWDSPPEVEPGHHYHAGMFPNCRCYPEPVLTEE